MPGAQASSPANPVCLRFWGSIYKICRRGRLRSQQYNVSLIPKDHTPGSDLDQPITLERVLAKVTSTTLSIVLRGLGNYQRHLDCVPQANQSIR